MLKQVILDMQNQLIQVKTQVAIAIADQHLLAKKLQENEQASEDLLRRAEIELRVRETKSLPARQLRRPSVIVRWPRPSRSNSTHQKIQVEHLKSALRDLEVKMTEARNRSELLAAASTASWSPLSRAVAARAVVTGDDRSSYTR